MKPAISSHQNICNIIKIQTSICMVSVTDLQRIDDKIIYIVYSAFTP